MQSRQSIKFLFLCVILFLSACKPALNSNGLNKLDGTQVSGNDNNNPTGPAQNNSQSQTDRVQALVMATPLADSLRAEALRLMKTAPTQEAKNALAAIAADATNVTAGQGVVLLDQSKLILNCVATQNLNYQDCKNQILNSPK